MSKKRVPVAYPKDGLPYDEHDHVLDPLSCNPEDDEPSGESFTDPFETMRWMVGVPHLFQCFEYAFVPDGRVILHAQTVYGGGSQIEEEAYYVLDQKEAPIAAHQMVGAAEKWMKEQGIEHDSTSFDQDSTWFARCVTAAVESVRGKAIPMPSRFEEDDE